MSVIFLGNDVPVTVINIYYQMGASITFTRLLNGPDNNGIIRLSIKLCIKSFWLDNLLYTDITALLANDKIMI